MFFFKLSVITGRFLRQARVSPLLHSNKFHPVEYWQTLHDHSYRKPWLCESCTKAAHLDNNLPRSITAQNAPMWHVPPWAWLTWNWSAVLLQVCCLFTLGLLSCWPYNSNCASEFWLLFIFLESSVHRNSTRSYREILLTPKVIDIYSPKRQQDPYRVH